MPSPVGSTLNPVVATVGFRVNRCRVVAEVV